MENSQAIERFNPPVVNSELEFKPENTLSPESINEQLKAHQLAADWDKKELIQDLHMWQERFTLEFKLKIKELPAIMIDKLTSTVYGYFRPGRNGFGLRNEIALNDKYICEKETWQLLGTFLHELLHAEQEQSGRPGKYNYHNKAFRDRAASFGLIVDSWGHMQYTPAPSPFWDILAKYQITPTKMPPQIESQAAAPGNSKLKLWICDCKPQPVRVRVAIGDFQAKCLKCGSVFRKMN